MTVAGMLSFAFLLPIFLSKSYVDSSKSHHPHFLASIFSIPPGLISILTVSSIGNFAKSIILFTLLFIITVILCSVLIVLATRDNIQKKFLFLFASLFQILTNVFWTIFIIVTTIPFLLKILPSSISEIEDPSIWHYVMISGLSSIPAIMVTYFGVLFANKDLKKQHTDSDNSTSAVHFLLIPFVVFMLTIIVSTIVGSYEFSRGIVRFLKTGSDNEVVYLVLSKAQYGAAPNRLVENRVDDENKDLLSTGPVCVILEIGSTTFLRQAKSKGVDKEQGYECWPTINKETPSVFSLNSQSILAVFPYPKPPPAQPKPEAAKPGN